MVEIKFFQGEAASRNKSVEEREEQKVQKLLKRPAEVELRIVVQDIAHSQTHTHSHTHTSAGPQSRRHSRCATQQERDVATSEGGKDAGVREGSLFRKHLAATPKEQTDDSSQ